jgi:hypothetical protein
VVVFFAPAASFFTGFAGFADRALPKATKRVAEGGSLWVAYPKAGQLGTDLNRDSPRACSVPRGWSVARMRGSMTCERRW